MNSALSWWRADRVHWACGRECVWPPALSLFRVSCFLQEAHLSGSCFVFLQGTSQVQRPVNLSHPSPLFTPSLLSNFVCCHLRESWFTITVKWFPVSFFFSFNVGGCQPVTRKCCWFWSWQWLVSMFVWAKILVRRYGSVSSHYFVYTYILNVS